MTSILFRILGALSFLVGAAWAIMALGVPMPATSTSAASAGAVLGKIATISPGIGLAITGLLFLAIGEALGHLQRIARSSAKTALNTADLLKSLSKPALLPDAAANFNDAVQLFQAKTGKAEPGAAIRDLATDALRQRGFLR